MKRKGQILLEVKGQCGHQHAHTDTAIRDRHRHSQSHRHNHETQTQQSDTDTAIRYRHRHNHQTQPSDTASTTTTTTTITTTTTTATTTTTTTRRRNTTTKHDEGKWDETLHHTRKSTDPVSKLTPHTTTNRDCQSNLLHLHNTLNKSLSHNTYKQSWKPNQTHHTIRQRTF